MKKQYSKPGIIIEDFKISQHIASCGAPHESQWGSPLSGSPASCAWLGFLQVLVWVLVAIHVLIYNTKKKTENSIYIAIIIQKADLLFLDLKINTFLVYMVMQNSMTILIYKGKNGEK